MALNVLVVDDSQVMRRMIVKTLRMSGLPVAEVYEAADGSEGLAQLHGHWIDLALVDINMPKMSGEEMLRQVRAEPALRDLATVVVSTEGSDARIAALKALGAAFVHKPFTPETLRATVLAVTGLTEDDLHNQTSPDGGDGCDF